MKRSPAARLVRAPVVPLRLVLALAAAILAACGPDAPAPAPRVIAVVPEGEGIAPDLPGIAVSFSEPVEPSGVEDGRFVALAAEADAKSVASAVATATGLTSTSAVVPVRIVLGDGGRRADLTPDAPLAPMSSYAVVVGTGIRSASGRAVLDPTGRKRAYAVAFRTGPIPDRVPPVARWIVPPHGPVPANLKELRVGFSEEVTGALAISGVSGTPRTVAADVLAFSPAGALTGMTLAPLLDGVRDGAGNRPPPLPSVAVSSCQDLVPPALDATTVRILPSDTAIAVSAEAGEVARLGVEVSALQPGGACGAVPEPPATLVAWGDFAACPGADPCGARTRCLLTAAVAGVCPGRGVKVRLRVEDLAGNVSAPGDWMPASTGSAAARVVLTEVLADAATPQAGGEYVEIANLGSGDADLTGWKLAKRGATGAVTRCAIDASAGPLPPGGHGLVVGGSWDGRYAVPAGVPLYRCGATSLLGGLADDRAPALALEDAKGALVSGLGWSAAAVRCTGRSTERIHPAGDDATANLACAKVAPGTPGACNGNTPSAECPRRPY